ncbi:MAG: carboxypeptidase-like regulatory domain-containing protein [Cytophagales bacterium]
MVINAPTFLRVMALFVNTNPLKLLYVLALSVVVSSQALVAQPTGRHSFHYSSIRFEDALFTLTKIYGVKFSYGSKEVPVDRLITLQATDKTLKEVLDNTLPPLHVRYKWIGHGITLTSIPLRQNIRGRVVDKDTGEPLEGVNVVIHEHDSILGSTTNAEGFFLITNVVVGRHTIQATYLGYEDAQQNDVLVYTGKEPMIFIGMKEAYTRLQEVVVRPEQSNGQPVNIFSLSGGRSFSVEETKRFASNFNDAARMITAYPGITATSDVNNSISIRGNSPNSMQWRLEGVEIPSPNHFAGFGGSGGAVSMLSINLLDNSDFYSGAFAAEYGNALSGIMDMKLRKGNHEKSEKSFQLSFLGIDAAAEGPFKKGKKASYLANYRYSTAGILVNFGVLPQGAAPTYQDLSFNLSFPLSFGALNVWGVAGDGIFNENASSGSKNNLTTSSLLSGITLVTNFNKNLSITTAVSATYTQDKLVQNQLYNNVSEEIFWTRNKGESFRISTQLNNKFSPGSLLRAGFIVSYRNYQLGQRYIDFTDNKKLKTPLDSEGTTDYLQAYAQWKKNVGEKFTVNAGLHAIYVARTQKYSVEPRLGLSYQFSETGSVGAAVGLHSQLQPLTLLYQKIELPDHSFDYLNKNLDLSKALHYVLSYDKQLRKTLHVRAEVYYQSLYQIPVYSGSSSSSYSATFSALNFFSEYLGRLQVIEAIQLANTGTGENYGLEISFDKRFSNDHYFLITGSLYQSHYRGADGVLRNTSFNGRHLFTALAGKEYRTGVRKSNVFELNARVSWAGNSPQTPIDIATSLTQRQQVYDYTRSYEAILPDYFRVDVHVGFRKSRARAAHIWSFDIRNLTNRQNPRYEYLNFNTQQISYQYQLGLIPVLSYRIEF